jgi:hypothetical protein
VGLSLGIPFLLVLEIRQKIKDEEAEDDPVLKLKRALSGLQLLPFMFRIGPPKLSLVNKKTPR